MVLVQRLSNFNAKIFCAANDSFHFRPELAHGLVYRDPGFPVASHEVEPELQAHDASHDANYCGTQGDAESGNNVTDVIVFPPVLNLREQRPCEGCQS